MTLELKLDGTNLPLPRSDQPYDSEYLGFGTQFRTWDATLKTQRTGNKWRLRIYWAGLSLAEKDSLMTTFSNLLATAGTLTLPDGANIQVQGILGSWNERVWFQPRPPYNGYYDVSFQVEQV